METNYPPGESIAPNVIVAAALCPAFAALLIGVRFYTAHGILRRIHVDDWLILPAFVFALAYSILQFCQIQYGLGRHIREVPPESLEMFNKVGIASSIAYNFSTLFIKASILVFYLRFPSELGFRYTVYVVMVVAIGYSLFGGFGFLYLCQPIARLWDYTLEGQCVDLNAWFLACAALNVATDLVILIMPLWILRPLRVRLAQKVAVAAILMAGGFVLGASIVRLVAIPAGFNDTDMTWRFAINIIWCILEMYIGIICACLPCLKAFAKHVWPSLFERFNPEREQVTLNSISGTLRSLPGVRRLARPWRGTGPTLLDDVNDSKTAVASKGSTVAGSVQSDVDGKQNIQRTQIAEAGDAV